MKIFLICGKSGSGKGEVANIIKEYFIYKKENTVITEFSKPLKAFAKELTDWNGELSAKPRGYLQGLGDKIRSIDEKFFINSMLNDLRMYENLTNNVVISDVRFPMEIDDIKTAYDNVYAIYVENNFSQSKLSITEQTHITETALDSYNDFDYMIVNDNYESLRDKVFKIMEEVMKDEN